MFASPSEKRSVPSGSPSGPSSWVFFLLIGLWTGVCAALWRRFLPLPYQNWYLMHRVGMFSAVVIFTLHVWNVNDDFHRGWPFYSLSTALLLYGVLFLWMICIKPMLLRRRLFTVTRVEPAGKDAHAVELVPGDGKRFPTRRGSSPSSPFCPKRCRWKDTTGPCLRPGRGGKAGGLSNHKVQWRLHSPFGPS